MTKLSNRILEKRGHPWLIQIRPSSAQIVVPVSPLALRSRSSSPTKASLTNPNVVLNADKQGKSSAAVHKATGVATAIKEGKCIQLSAPLVAKIHRSLSSQEKGDRCIAATVTLKLRARPTFRKTNTEEKE